MSIRMGRAARLRPNPLPNPALYYGYGKYPERLRLSFFDGGTEVYFRCIQQPRPTFFSIAEINRMNKQPYSYLFGGAA